MPEVTPEVCSGLWAFLSEKYGTTVKDKRTAAEMKVLANVLDLMKVTDKQVFLNEYTTTLGTTIYAPFTVGVPSAQHTLFSQVVVGAHEHQHVVQLALGGFDFLAGYLLDSTWRCSYEAEAYRVSMTMSYHLTGTMPDPARYAAAMANYGVGAQGVKFVQEYLRLSMPTIKAGGIPDEAARVSLQWLRENAPQVLAV